MIYNRKTIPIMNTFAGQEGALGVGDRGAFQSIPANTGNPYESNNYLYRWRQYCHLYETCWEARKIIRIPVEDALRKDWDVEGIPEQMLKILRKRADELHFVQSLSRSMMLERLLGGCLQFFGLESDKDDVSASYDPRIHKSKLRFINVIPCSRISRVDWETDPMAEGYMRPKEYLVNGHRLHLSRCIVWDGEPLFDPYDFMLTQFRVNLSGFGPSKLAPIWGDIIKAVGTRQAAYQLIQTNNAIVMAVSELQDLMATAPGQANIKLLKEIANNLSQYRAAIIQKDKVDITTTSAKFGSVPELLMTFLQVLSAASDIPATRFLGQAPGGLNATGESDLENYYNMIDSLQRARIKPAILRFYDIVGYQKWPQSWDRIRDKIEIVFPPLWNMNELEEAQKNQIELTNVFQAWEQGLMSDKKAIDEINLKKIFSTDLDEKDIDLMKGMDDSGFYGDGGQGNDPRTPSVSPVASRSGTGQGVTKGQDVGTSTDDIKAPALKKPSLPQISNTTQKINIQGLEISVEHWPGQTRSGVDEEGKPWSTTFTVPYGFILSAGRKGADQGYIDCFVGSKQNAKTIYVINQQNKAGKFDEHKVMIGFSSIQEAKNVYLENYEAGWTGIQSIFELPMKEFKEWLDSGDTKQAFYNKDTNFREEDHPRADDGKFGSGGTKANADTLKGDKGKGQAFEEKIAHHTEADQKAHKEAKAKGLAVPPGWTSVWINPDPEAATLATGRDSKDRKVYLRSKKAAGEAAIEKFERVKEFAKVMPGLRKRLSADFDSSEEAKVLYLITKTGFRVGGEKDTKAEVSAYGASTLKPEHITVTGDQISFNFTGKKGVAQAHIIEDAKLAKIFEERKGQERIFKTNDVKVLKALKAAAGEKYLVKDIRTHVATAVAIRLVRDMFTPTTEKERKKAILEVATKVSQKLGNTPEMARDSYISPEVFAGWEIKK